MPCLRAEFYHGSVTDYRTNNQQQGQEQEGGRPAAVQGRAPHLPPAHGLFGPPPSPAALPDELVRARRYRGRCPAGESQPRAANRGSRGEEPVPARKRQRNVHGCNAQGRLLSAVICSKSIPYHPLILHCALFSFVTFPCSKPLLS